MASGEDTAPSSAPLLSVLLPVFNAADTLEPLLDSVRAQTLHNFELIAIDDGSDDASPELLRSIAVIDPRVRLVRQANAGLSASRNRGLQLARGRWIGFVDADDWLDPATFATWVERAEEDSLDLLVGNGFRFVGSSPATVERIPIRKSLPAQQIVSGRHWICDAVARKEWFHFAWLQLIRADLLREKGLRFVEGIVHEDIVWTLRLALAADRVGFVQEPLYGYRSNPASITNTPTAEGVKRRLRSYLVVLEALRKAAAGAGDADLRKALLRHANRETLHFVSLLRRPQHPPRLRRVFARRYLAAGLARAIFDGAVDHHDLWRAARCWFALCWYAAQRGRRS